MVEHTEADPPARRRGLGLRGRDLALLAGLLVVVAVVTALVFRSPASTHAPDGATATQTAQLDGLTVTRPKAAPPLALRNYLGTPVNIASYRGKAVLVTFLYTHCPDVCPLIASKLHTAVSEMPASERRELQIIAVSVDPRGDTPTTVAQFLAEHKVIGEMQYLIGSAGALARVWANWGIASQPSSNPAVVDHTALIYGISAQGKINVIYPANFPPSWIVHDVRVLART